MLRLGGGNDQVRAGRPDGKADRFNCGAGTDVVSYTGRMDPRDVLIKCDGVAVQLPVH